MTDHIPTAEEVDDAVRTAINTALAYEASQLSETEHVRLKLALASPSEDVDELLDAVMTVTCEQIADCVCAILNSVALEPGDD